MGPIAVVGASGFVGKDLVQSLNQAGLECLALTRSKPKNLPENVQWRAVDLFSHKSTLDALQGVHTAIYLVHSMMPSSHLFQGNFHDTDLLLADNFARACVANKVSRIIYLSGVMPEGYVSPHLQSRFDVEEVMKATSIPVTVLRAGMIVGPGGSSFEILRTLVERLPVMVLPEWTQRSTQAIFIDDVIAVVLAAVKDSSFDGKAFDVVNGERLTYKVLLHTMARALGKKRWMLPIPIRSTEFSKLWVRIFGNSTKELVSPLIDSLLCDLPQVCALAPVDSLIRYKTFQSMVEETLRRDAHHQTRAKPRKKFDDKSVRSIQRLPSVPDHNCDWIAHQYMQWLPKFFPALLQVKFSPDQESVQFHLAFFPKPLLILKYVKGSFEDDRRKFHIVGGILAQTTNTGWLEFRQVSHKKFTLAAIHQFVPRLPWVIYILIQAPLHKFVMTAFGKSLTKS